MITIYVTYMGKDEETLNNFYSEVEREGIIKLSRQEKGNIRYDYYKPMEKSNELFLLEKWESKEAHKEHSVEPHFKKLGQIKEKYNIKTDIIIECVVKPLDLAMGI